MSNKKNLDNQLLLNIYAILILEFARTQYRGRKLNIFLIF